MSNESEHCLAYNTHVNDEQENQHTWLSVKSPTTYGPIIPGIVPAALVIPISTPANLGAISKWLTLKEAVLKLDAPRPSENKITARLVDSQPT